MTSIIDEILSEEEITYFIEHTTAIAAKNKLTGTKQGSIYFSVEVPEELKIKLSKKLKLNIASLNSIPMVWIKGDTLPHIDRSSRDFENTYLIYLTDNSGKLVINGEQYPISRGKGYIFPEGTKHETIGTGFEPRLLLGPMSEMGIPVGTTISGDGATDTVYIKEEGGQVLYKINNGNWNIVSWSINVININSNPSANILKVIFTTDITINFNYMYFGVGSSGIQFGSTLLNLDGSRPKITITASDYNGLIYNGGSGFNGFNNISIYNLVIDGTGGSQQIGAGWFGHKYFGNGANNNYIINCSSIGQIGRMDGAGGGGILGDFAGNVTLIGCSSSGVIYNNAGGIVGQFAGDSGNQVNCNSCWSTGSVISGNDGDGAGGIVGSNSVNVIISNCYSNGAISGTNSGGILGSNPGSTSATIQNCYSTGNISGSNSGGICGSLGIGTFNIIINNCYSLGNINGSNQAGGICGNNFSSSVVAISNCYTVGTTTGSTGYITGNSTSVPATCYSEAANSSSGWSSSSARAYLEGAPTNSNIVGTTWVETFIEQPYELRNMGYTPFTVQNISSTPTLNSTFNISVIKGSTTPPAIAFYKSYSILQIDGGDPASYGEITINSITGEISTTGSTSTGIYILYIRNSGSYNITEVELTVGGGPIPCLLADTMVRTEEGYTNITALKIGDLVTTSDNRQVKIVNITKTIVPGNLNTWPCIVRKGIIGKNYPPQDLQISQKHLIFYKNHWLLPRKHFSLNKKLKVIQYYHIELENYITDHLVVNGGTIVESLGITNNPSKQKEYLVEYRKRLSPKTYTSFRLKK